MYKNRVENDMKFFWNSFILRTRKFSKKWENSKYICYFEFSCTGFPHSQDKRKGIFFCFSTLLFLYIPESDCNRLICSNIKRHLILQFSFLFLFYPRKRIAAVKSES